LDFLHVEAVMQRAQPLELARLQGHRRVVAQPCPLLAGEYPVGIILLVRRPNIHGVASWWINRACARLFLPVRIYSYAAQVPLRHPRASRRAPSAAPANETADRRSRQSD